MSSDENAAHVKWMNEIAQSFGHQSWEVAYHEILFDPGEQEVQ
jgi:hypothetical protein